MNKALVAALLGAGMMVSTGALAQVTYSGSSTGPRSGGSYASFDNRTLGSSTQMTGTGITVSFTGGGAFVQGSSAGAYAAPYVYGGAGSNFMGQANGVDATTYISSGIGSATLTFFTPQTYLGLLWGSVDSFNTLSFYSGTTLIQQITGTQVLNGPGASNLTNTSLYENFTSTTPFTSVVASSTQNSFEIDDVAFGAAVPEAATWTMMMVGLGVVGASLRRRQKVSTRVSFA